MQFDPKGKKMIIVHNKSTEKISYILSTHYKSVTFFKTIYRVYKKGYIVPFINCPWTNPNQHQRTQHLSSQSNMHFPKENRPPGKNQLEKLHTEEEDKMSDSR